MNNFIEFIKEQGVIGFAIAFIIGTAISTLVNALVRDIINPIIALGLGNLDNLSNAYFQIGEAKIMWGDFANASINFLVIALVIYILYTSLGLKNLDKKNNN